MTKLTAQTPNKSSGFTLIELLIVVAIIAVLSVIGVVMIGSAQSNARDARRQGDIVQITKALDVAKVSGSLSTYPALTNSLFANGAIPTDPNRTYCVSTTTSSTATLLANPATWTGTTCVAGTPGTGQTGWVKPTDGAPAVGSYIVRVCASIENKGTDKVVCSTTQQ